jgi:hypothetical protein
MAAGVFLPIVSEYIDKGTKKAITEFKSLTKASDKANFALKKATLPAIAALGALGVAGKKALDAGEAVGSANARILQINRSMGLFGDQSAQVTKRLIKLAEAQGVELGISNLTIKATQAKLLTFKELAKTADIVGGTFDRANAAALDLAAAGFGSAESNAVQLGKALNDPIKGITALTKSGVTFTEEEKTKIKTLVESNKTLEAQQLILAAIEKQVGGTAKATADDSKKMSEAFAQVQQSLGSALLPALQTVTPLLLGFANWAKNNPRLFVTVGVAIGGIAAAVLAARGAFVAYRAIAITTTAVNTALAASGFAVQISTGVGIATAIAGAGALAVITAKIVAATSANVNYADSTDKATEETGKLKNMIDGAKKAAEGKRAADEAAAGAIDKVAAAAEKASAAAKKLAGEIKDLRKEIATNFGKALETATEKLKEARDNFNSYANSVSSAITSQFSLSTAFSGAAQNAKALSDATKEQTEATKKQQQAQLDLIKARESGDPKEIETATKTYQQANVELQNAVEGVNVAQSAPMTFFDSLEAQAAKARDFGVLVNRLIAGGLSEQALEQVLAAGVDAGSGIATELLSSADGIIKANTLAADVASVGASVGANAASSFKSAGVTAGQNLVNGINEVVSKFSLQLKSKSLSKKQLQNLRKNFGVSVDFLLSGNVPQLANGGIVKATPGGTLALIGEGGRDEAVIPLDKAGGMGGGNTIIIQGAIDPISTARQIEKILAGQTSRFGY